jgi:hypothetical protein
MNPIRLAKDTRDQDIDPKSVTYMLYMRNSIETLRVGDSVLVATLDNNPFKSKKKPLSRSMEYTGPPEGMYYTEYVTRFSGTIKKTQYAILILTLSLV